MEMKSMVVWTPRAAVPWFSSTAAAVSLSRQMANPSAATTSASSAMIPRRIQTMRESIRKSAPPGAEFRVAETPL